MGNIELNLDGAPNYKERAFLVVRDAPYRVISAEYYAAPTADALTAALANDARGDLYTR